MTYEEYEALIPPAHRYPNANSLTRADLDENVLGVLPDANRLALSRFGEFVLLCIKQGVDYANLLDSYLEKFDLDLAVGKQLDYLGAIVGANRQLPFAVEGSDGFLGDDDFRLLIRARIAANAWDGTNESLAEILRTIFAAYGVSFIDNGILDTADPTYENMHMSYEIRGGFTDIQKNMIRGDLIFPRPAGVSVEFHIIDTLTSTDISTETRLASEYGKAEMMEEVEVPDEQGV